MQDLCHEMNQDGLFVLSVQNNDLVPVQGMESAILVSLFTDQRIDESDLRIPIDRGGWFGNVLTPNRELGSKLWGLENAKITSGLIGNIKEYAQRSFDWMTEDGLARKVEVGVNLKSQDVFVSAKITGRSDPIGNDYSYLWRRTQRRAYNYG
ncbi:phage GP46 family protein [Neisseria sp. Ec49-e6-T10]|uniref:phage GP46 family protein n=1 Tax=Neisseria sp. Ec49-e6-T10 TaxID=3140744 RepID=UPI003EB9881C